MKNLCEPAHVGQDILFRCAAVPGACVCNPLEAGSADVDVVDSESLGKRNRQGILNKLAAADSTRYPSGLSNKTRESKLLCTRDCEVHEDIVPRILAAQRISLLPLLQNRSRGHSHHCVARVPAPQPVMTPDRLAQGFVVCSRPPLQDEGVFRIARRSDEGPIGRFPALIWSGHPTVLLRTRSTRPLLLAAAAAIRLLLGGVVQHRLKQDERPLWFPTCGVGEAQSSRRTVLYVLQWKCGRPPRTVSE